MRYIGTSLFVFSKDVDILTEKTVAVWTPMMFGDALTDFPTVFWPDSFADCLVGLSVSMELATGAER